MSVTPKHIAIFASGTGSNARKILEYFAGRTTVKVALIVSNNSNAGVLDIALEFGIPSLVVNREALNQGDELNKALDKYGIDGIVLAGFMLLIPAWLVQRYPNKIINIHPALLPKHGGKGMYGMHVHRAVKEQGDTESGITIHVVNEQYDEGNIIFQDSCSVVPDDTPESIAAKVQVLEHQHYPRIIEQVFS